MNIKWVKLKKYCELTRETPSSVHGKRNTGMWIDGRHCKIGPDGNLWVNLIEVEKWVEQPISSPNQEQRHRTGLKYEKEKKVMQA